MTDTKHIPTDYFDFLGSSGLVDLVGISQIPLFIAPLTLPSLQSICTLRAVIPHFLPASAVVMYSILPLTSVSLVKCVNNTAYSIFAPANSFKSD